jgi:hypothetical protein
MIIALSSSFVQRSHADQIRPDWEAKLNAVRAAVARRANRRIVMRQVGDQLIPVGITSGRVVALPPGSEGGVAIDEGTGSRRRRRAERNGNNPDFQQLLGQMGMGGQDIEEVSNGNFTLSKKRKWTTDH